MYAFWSVVLAGLVLVISPAAVGAGRAAAAAVVSVSCSAAGLSAAITAANGGGPTTLVLAADCDYLISVPATPGTGLPPITGTISLLGGHGPNVDAGRGTTTISRDPAAPTSAFSAARPGGTLWVQSLTIANAKATGLGGGILNAGSLLVADSALTGSVAEEGGGLANLFGAAATVISSGFNANAATAFLGGGAIINQGILTVRSSRLSSNTASQGGGLNTQQSGVSTLIQSAVAHNAAVVGGGINNVGSTCLVRSTVEFNTASCG
jgi:hypothetical protein